MDVGLEFFVLVWFVNAWGSPLLNGPVMPDRGGNQDIPWWNITAFYGKSAPDGSVYAAHSSRHFDRVFVSSDVREFALVSREIWAKVPCVGSVHLANGYAVTQAVIAHVIDYWADGGHLLSPVCCLCAAAPFVQAQDLWDLIKFLR